MSTAEDAAPQPPAAAGELASDPATPAPEQQVGASGTTAPMSEAAVQPPVSPEKEEGQGGVAGVDGGH
eukprot:CAMPEP_0114120596 /NCGR_PEP_ID=MMETSP0043_2-20121206/6735_1 /TAXON_ID=464988 /ORGANISM="Hemiselmis andersenii, Strain CCMP644" /LENGTH=67 /DNA_ID=CAMNT_0001213233 /DNA_START=570 /DNA_END=770 /DNA_ORIENTATION=-